MSKFMPALVVSVLATGAAVVCASVLIAVVFVLLLLVSDCELESIAAEGEEARSVLLVAVDSLSEAVLVVCTSDVFSVAVGTSDFVLGA